TWKRVALAAALGLWCFSSILNFPFTPVSSFTGELVYGSIVLFGVASVVVPVALRELAYLELGSIRSLLRATSSEYKKNMSFVGKGPIRAIYFYHLSFLEMMGRVNIGVSTSYRACRVRASTVLVVSVTAPAVFLFLTGLSPFPWFAFRPAVFVVPVFLGIISPVFISQAS